MKNKKVAEMASEFKFYLSLTLKNPIVWGGLLASLTVTFIIWSRISNNSEHDLQEYLDRAEQDAMVQIRNHFKLNESILLSAKGVLDVAPGLSRTQWKNFVADLKIEKDIPGILGLGFAVRVTPEQKQAHILKVRSEGFLDYQIKTYDNSSKENKDFYPVLYLEPFDQRNQRAFGLDLFSEPARHEALDVARRTGNTSISRPITLVQETENNHQYGILMSVPVYNKGSLLNTEAARVSANRGFVYIPIRINNLIDAAFNLNSSNDPNSKWLDIEINDASDSDALLFHSNPEYIHHESELAHLMKLNVYGRIWTINFIHKEDSFIHTKQQRPKLALVMGCFLSAVLYFFLLELVGSRNRALALAKQMVDELQQSEFRFKSIFDLTSFGICIANMNGQIIEANSAFASIFGYLESELQNLNWKNLIFLDDLNISIELFKQVVEGSLPVFKTEKRYIHKNGQIIWGNVSIVKLNDNSMLAVFEDISVRKEVEKENLEILDRFQLTMQTSLEGIHVFDEHGDFFECNESFAKMLGYTREELVHMNARDWDVQWNASELQKNIDDLFNQKQAFFNTLHKRKDGSVIEVEIGAVGITSHGKKFVWNVSRDISQRMKSEKELRSAKERAQSATNLKDKFVALVAHDLRGPIGTITQLNKILLQDQSHPLVESQRNIINNIIGSCERLTLFIEDILSLNRLKGGQLIPEKKFIDPGTAVQSVIDMFKTTPNSKNINLVNNIPFGFLLYVDEGLFKEVISNLITNSIKFCNKGGTVTVHANIPGRGNKNSAPFEIVVSDNGLGIFEKYIPHLFESAVKTTMPGSEGEKGTGLGLPLCYDIMKAHGGLIQAENNLDAGAKFSLRFPYLKPQIAVLDDEEINRTLIKGFFASLDAEIIELQNVDEAITQIQKSLPHLLISDIMMPGRNGFDLLTWINENSFDFPVLVITADASIETREKAFRFGADDFITKPILYEELLPRVRKLIINEKNMS